MAVDASGDVFVADSSNNRVVELTKAGVQSTVGFAGMVYPQGVAVDASGDVFVAAEGANQVLELTPGGVQSTVAFTGLERPAG